ncbi:hypothetical protein HMPREF3214_01594, partial [Alloscardovia omnicolens]
GSSVLPCSTLKSRAIPLIGCVCCTRKTKGYGVHSILGNLFG